MPQPHSAKDNNAVKEAENFAFYLLKKKPKKSIIERYHHILQNNKSAPAPTALDRKILIFSVNHPWSIGPLDSYLALFNPQSTFRYRIYIMLAVLESAPEYTNYFLPTKRHPFYFVYVAYTAIKTFVKVPFGLVLMLAARAL